MEKTISIFSPLLESGEPSSSELELIEICCDVDIHSYPSQETIGNWDWAALDAILSSNTFMNLERLEITVKTVLRSRTTWQLHRKYKDLEKLLVELFRSRLPLVLKMGKVISGSPVAKDR